MSRFLKWLVEFSCTRYDIKHGQLVEREATLTERVDSLEALVTRQGKELADGRQMIGVLATALHTQDPDNPALRRVAAVLRVGVPLTPSDMDDSLDALLARIDLRDQPQRKQA